MSPRQLLIATAIIAISLFTSSFLRASELPSHDALKATLTKIVAEKNGGFGLQMWACVVDRDGVVQRVVFSGADRGDQWPGSRVIAAQKANTANAFSLPGLALSTANLFTAVQPGGSLYGLQHSNPVDTKVAYGGSSDKIGSIDDPMVGGKIGGVNIFGGGLALYDETGKLIGALGVSGDSSCADHNIAWKLRHALKLDFVPAGVSASKDDNIVNDITDGKSVSGWGHASTTDEAATIAKAFPQTHPVSKKK
ncbi:MAG: heme-binding protein [Planctomycetes bacterium]|nr:heme-binding protein [Planctomycetota bacterium]